ncbi:hypothetical protein KC939_00090 [Candidatus Saccharibacteria bacterium]|nr:hypothetical protein [Candidatus Saccharibacteria bacterium]
MESSPAVKHENHEEQPQEVVKVGSVVAVEFGDGHQRVFVVTNTNRELPDGATQDMLPEGMLLAPETMPLVRDIAGQPAGYSIEPITHIKSKDFPAYRREGVTVVDVAASLNEFLARSNDDSQSDTDNKPD